MGMHHGLSLTNPPLRKHVMNPFKEIDPEKILITNLQSWMNLLRRYNVNLEKVLKKEIIVHGISYNFCYLKIKALLEQGKWIVLQTQYDQKMSCHNTIN